VTDEELEKILTDIEGLHLATMNGDERARGQFIAVGVWLANHDLLVGLNAAAEAAAYYEGHLAPYDRVVRPRSYKETLREVENDDDEIPS
jgi:hypothetical protein